ncbi:hypothetical protein DSM07_06790 [Oenococcus sp. UCMA 16435]|nr:hypothetical protein DSM07_06790 [Oenococcus sp. UCMA 16435]MDI4584508.1 hypothetical protein [Oenococcus sp. UCMA 14587]MDN6968868.1 hypothetical protein [Oenococcus sp. UCMA 17063]
MNDLINKQYLAHIPTLPLLAVLLITIFLAYYLPYHFRDVYDPVPITKFYALYLIVILLANLIIFHVRWILVLGIYLMGILILVFRSNHYFYKR